MPSSPSSRRSPASRPAGRRARAGTSPRPAGGGSSRRAVSPRGASRSGGGGVGSGGPAGTPRRRNNLTGRAAILAIVVCGLILTLAYPLRQFVAQRAHIAELREQTQAQAQRVEQLKRQSARWDDPAYVKAQARQRLHYAMPGETQYVVLEPEEAPTPTQPPAPEPGSVVAPENAGDQPWFTALWQSVEGADDAELPAPAGTPEPTP